MHHLLWREHVVFRVLFISFATVFVVSVCSEVAQDLIKREILTNQSGSKFLKHKFAYTVVHFWGNFKNEEAYDLTDRRKRTVSWQLKDFQVMCYRNSSRSRTCSNSDVHFWHFICHFTISCRERLRKCGPWHGLSSTQASFVFIPWNRMILAWRAGSLGI